MVSKMDICNDMVSAWEMKPRKRTWVRQSLRIYSMLNLDGFGYASDVSRSAGTLLRFVKKDLTMLENEKYPVEGSC
jgi:hypothetical protein